MIDPSPQARTVNGNPLYEIPPAVADLESSPVEPWTNPHWPLAQAHAWIRENVTPTGEIEQPHVRALVDGDARADR